MCMLSTCIDWLSLMSKHHLSSCYLLFMVYDLCHGATVMGRPEVLGSFLLSAFHGSLTVGLNTSIHSLSLEFAV